MNGPRELFTALLRLVTGLTVTIIAVTAWIHWHFVYPVTRTVESWIYQFGSVMQQGTLQSEQFSLLMAPQLNHLFHPFPSVFNGMTMATVSTMDAMTVVAIYSMYVWPDVVIQTIQSAMELPSVELSIEGDVPGGIAVWLVVAFALVTYAFVYLVRGRS